jgi:hypothetical protein
MSLQAGMDVFVLGFPFAMQPTGGFPIWKRASVATEPDIAIDDLPKFFVDTATRPGMSGSPVILRSWGDYMTVHGEVSASPFICTKFVGVYSGRVSDARELNGTPDHVRTEQEADLLRAQLGVVWKAHVVDEIIDGQRSGTVP